MDLMPQRRSFHLERVCVMINMHTIHDFIREAETILFYKESNTVQGISCLLDVNTPVQTFLLINSHKNLVSTSLCFPRSDVCLTENA